ncbi:MAG: YqgE/AlgH family protein [bacterium]
MNSETEISQGKLLLSAPFLGDVFNRTVILLTEHYTEGSVGFILNKPTDLKLHEVIEDFPEFDAKVFAGGPVQYDSLNFIHKANDVLEGGVEIINGVFWGGNFELLKILISNGSLDPQDFKFFLGYSGWGNGQLENEMKHNSWYLSASSIENIFDNDSPKLWSNVMRSMGKQYGVIASFPEDASLN